MYIENKHDPSADLVERQRLFFSTQMFEHLKQLFFFRFSREFLSRKSCSSSALLNKYDSFIPNLIKGFRNI